MPIYEYECKNCHQLFDLMQKISEPPIKKCPKCFEDTVIRLVSAAGFQLKGSGWYATDFKNKGKSESKKEEGKTEKAADSAAKTDDKKTDSTTATNTSKKGDSE